MASNLFKMIYFQAYYLVRKDVPFREAHTISSEVVHFAEKNNLAINEVSVKDLKTIRYLS